MRRLLEVPPVTGSMAPPTAATLRAVVVDDSPAALSLYRQVVSRTLQPIAVQTVASGAEALACLQDEPADLLLCDYHMPQMDGLQLLTLVAQQGLARRRVLFSSDTDRWLPARALEAGAHAFIPKNDMVSFMARLRAIAAPLRAS